MIIDVFETKSYRNEGCKCSNVYQLKKEIFVDVFKMTKMNLAAFSVSEMPTQPGQGGSNVLIEETVPIVKKGRLSLS